MKFFIDLTYILQYFLRHLDKEPVPAQNRYSKVFIITLSRPVWTGLLVFSVGLVLGPALGPGAGVGTAVRPKEILHKKILSKMTNYIRALE